MIKIIRSAAVILLKSNGHVLAQLRDNKNEIANLGMWAICGGGMETELDEDILTTAARELCEETGYAVNPNDLRFLYQEYVPGKEGVQIQNNYFWAPYDELQQLSCFEGQEIRFLSSQECRELNLVPKHRDLLLEVSGYLAGGHPETRR